MNMNPSLGFLYLKENKEAFGAIIYFDNFGEKVRAQFWREQNFSESS